MIPDCQAGGADRPLFLPPSELGYNPDMTEILTVIVSTLGMALGALAIRFVVRAVNRGQLPTRQLWLLASLLPALYVACLGPAILVVSSVPSLLPLAQAIYSPLEWFARNVPGPISDALNWYASLWR